MSHTLFTLGLPTTSSPWSYQHSLGITEQDVTNWWKRESPTVRTIEQDVSNIATALTPGAVPSTTPRPAPTLPPSAPSGDSTGTILVGVLIVGAAVGGLYYYKNKEGRFPWEKLGKRKAKAS